MPSWCASFTPSGHIVAPTRRLGGLRVRPLAREGQRAHAVRRRGDPAVVPTISRFYGIVIRMYFADHAPPHFHAVYAGEEAVIAIATLEVLRGALPDRALRMVREWASIHRDELDANWERTQIPELASIRDDRELFETVAVNREFGTIEWPGNIDLDPDVLRGDQVPAAGPALPRRVIQPA